jgi:hypothetical protein
VSRGVKYLWGHANYYSCEQKPFGHRERIAGILGARVVMSWMDISRRILAAVMLLALLIVTTPALALALSPQDSSAAMDCCKDGLCPMHQHKTSDSSGNSQDCGSSGHSMPIDSMRACDPAPNLALGISPFALIAPEAIDTNAPLSIVPVLQSLFAPIVIASPPSPPPRALTS